MNISKYTPSLLNPKKLEALLVQREQLASHLVSVTQDSVLSKSKHYSLLIGPRGIGKTHLISLVYYRVMDLKEIQGDLRIAWLREEEWGLSSFLDLVLRILRSLNEAYPAFNLEEKSVELYELSPELAEKQAIKLLLDCLGEGTLLLLMENLDDIFYGLGDVGQKKLRSFLQETGCCTIIATSQSLFNGVKLQTSPFYGFFRIRHLKDFTVNEAVNLLRKIAALEGNQELVQFLATLEGRSRVQAVHHLTGGNPRIYAVFSGFLTRESLDDLIGPFIQMLDDLTPYYQARMSWLSPQQRKILEVLCSRRYAMPVKYIAQQCFATSQTTSSQLKDLRDKGYVVSQSYGRLAFYELREPLMRICLAVKQVRGEPIQLIVEFLKVWYSRHKLQAIYDGLNNSLNQVKQLRGEKPLGRQRNLSLESQRTYLEQALGHDSQAETDPRISACVGILRQLERSHNYNGLLVEAEKLVNLRGSDLDYFALGNAFSGLDRYEEAIVSYNKALEIRSDDNAVWYNRGVAMGDLGSYEEAIASYEKALEINPESDQAWHNRGNALAKLGRNQEAITSYEKALEIRSENDEAWNNLGIALDTLSRYEESIASYEKALELNPSKDETWNNRGVALDNLGHYEEAIASYEKALAINPDQDASWNNLGFTLLNLGWNEEAIKSFKKGLGIKPDYYAVWNMLGIALANLCHYEEAIESYDKALQLNPEYDAVWNNRSNALGNLGRYEEAIASYDRLLEISPEYPWGKLSRAELRIANNISEETLDELEAEIRNLPEKGNKENWSFNIGLQSIFSFYQKTTQWEEWLTKIIQLFEGYDFLSAVTQGLTQHLKGLVSDMVSQTAAESWRDVWQDLVGDRPEFQIPLRLLNAVVEYKKSPDDPRIFLSLAIEERTILHQLIILEQTI